MNLEIIIPSDEPVRLLSAVLEGKARDHNTIARFRREHLPEAVEDLLYQMVQLLIKHGEISFEKSAVFIDGTKIEANAGRYTFVWKTGVTKNQAKLGEKIATELPLLVEKAGVGIAVPKQVTVQRLKKLRKQLYSQKEIQKVNFVYGKGHHDAEKDEYTCAQGKKLTAVGTKHRKSETGYAQEVTIYEFCTICKKERLPLILILDKML